MKFPTYEEMAKNVAEQALDCFLFDDKSIREWMQIIASEDAISRQAVLKLIYADWKYEGLESDVESLPPITSQPKMGRWIIKDGKEQGYDIAGVKTWYIQIMCDKCGFIKTAIEGRTGQYKFCPNCGAKMEKV